jgi:hypothetical protein
VGLWRHNLWVPTSEDIAAVWNGCYGQSNVVQSLTSTAPSWPVIYDELVQTELSAQ